MKKIILVFPMLVLLAAGCNSAPPPTSTNTNNSTATTPSDPVSEMIAQQPTDSGCPQEGHIKSPGSIDPATVTFDNQTAGDLKIYWIDFNGKRQLYSTLKAHTKFDQATWIGHVWVVADASDQCVKLESANAVEQTVVIN